MTTTRDDKPRYTDILGFLFGRRGVCRGAALPPAPDAVEAAEQVGTKAEGRSAPISQPTTTGGGPVAWGWVAGDPTLPGTYVVRTAKDRDDAVARGLPVNALYLATPPDPLTGTQQGDILVRLRHGKWMADVIGDTAHSGGWGDPVDAVRSIKSSAKAALSTRGSAPLDGEDV